MNERIRTIRGYNLDCFDWIRAADFYEMPIIKAESYIPDELIGFKKSGGNSRELVPEMKARK